MNDITDLDDMYMHATCTNITPLGSLYPGKMYKTLCGRETLYRGPSHHCNKCEALFGTWPCPLCGKPQEEH